MDKYKAESLSVKADATGIWITVVLQPSDELRPTYFVKHPSVDPAEEGTFTEADPQPGVSLRTSVTITDELARELANNISHYLVTR